MYEKKSSESVFHAVFWRKEFFFEKNAEKPPSVRRKSFTFVLPD